MATETGFACCDHSPCPYWLWGEKHLTVVSRQTLIERKKLWTYPLIKLSDSHDPFHSGHVCLFSENILLSMSKDSKTVHAFNIPNVQHQLYAYCNLDWIHPLSERLEKNESVQNVLQTGLNMQYGSLSQDVWYPQQNDYSMSYFSFLL